MNPSRLVLADQGLDASYVVLQIGGLEIMFRQSDVRALESASDVDGNNPRKESTGWIGYMRQRWPVYCLSDRLDLQGVVPTSRRTCALLAIEAGFIGVLCDDARIFKQMDGKRHAVPVAMKHADTPILELFPCGDKLLCISDPGRMSGHIERLVQRALLPMELPCLA
jgi:hypothetical protein